MHQPAGHPGSPRPIFLARAPLIGTWLVIVLVVLGTAVARLAGVGAPVPPSGTPVVARSLIFLDQPDGGILVRDGDRQTEVTQLEPGSNNFIRGTLRALARERRQHEIGAGTAFHLAAWPDGRLTLTDPSTGRMVGLDAFGSTNREAFARLLTLREGAQ
jgi:putative photosynthetic complex assembly protein